MEMTLSKERKHSTLSMCHRDEAECVVYPPIPAQTHLAQSNLKAMTTTSARIAPCMNLWLMQPGSGGEFCQIKKKKKTGLH